MKRFNIVYSFIGITLLFLSLAGFATSMALGDILKDKPILGELCPNSSYICLGINGMFTYGLIIYILSLFWIFPIFIGITIFLHSIQANEKKGGKKQ